MLYPYYENDLRVRLCLSVTEQFEKLSVVDNLPGPSFKDASLDFLNRVAEVNDVAHRERAFTLGDTLYDCPPPKASTLFAYDFTSGMRKKRTALPGAAERRSRLLEEWRAKAKALQEKAAEEEAETAKA